MTNTEVIETVDMCLNCGNTAILGNGLCRKCWDHETEHMEGYQSHSRPDYYRRNQEIFDMANSRVSYRTIGLKYDLTENAVHKIVRHVRLKRTVADA